MRILLFSSFNLQNANNKLILQKSLFAFYFLKLHLRHFRRLKVKKKSQSSRNQGFTYYFCLVIEGSGSRRPKNMWIRLIRIRIRNTGQMTKFAVVTYKILEYLLYQYYNFIYDHFLSSSGIRRLKPEINHIGSATITSMLLHASVLL
jgi:hypothetical protein